MSSENVLHEHDGYAPHSHEVRADHLGVKAEPVDGPAAYEALFEDLRKAPVRALSWLQTKQLARYLADAGYRKV